MTREIPNGHTSRFQLGDEVCRFQDTTGTRWNDFCGERGTVVGWGININGKLLVYVKLADLKTVFFDEELMLWKDWIAQENTNV